jgi:hypothetical protein
MLSITSIMYLQTFVKEYVVWNKLDRKEIKQNSPVILYHKPLSKSVVSDIKHADSWTDGKALLASYQCSQSMHKTKNLIIEIRNIPGGNQSTF